MTRPDTCSWGLVGGKFSPCLIYIIIIIIYIYIYMRVAIVTSAVQCSPECNSVSCDPRYGGVLRRVNQPCEYTHPQVWHECKSKRKV